MKNRKKAGGKDTPSKMKYLSPSKIKFRAAVNKVIDQNRQRREKARKNWFTLQTSLISLRVIPEKEMEELLQDEDYTQIKALTSFITATLVLMFSVSSFVYTLEAFQRLGANKNQIDYVFDNWKTPFLEDILVVDPYQTCPEGYEYLLDSKWAGTVSGCLCQATENRRSKLTIGSCNIKEHRKGCHTIKETPESSSHWIHNSTLCGKRSSLNFLELQKPDAENKCEIGLKMCGNTLPDFKFATCVPTDSPCPITDLAVSSTQSPSLGKNYEKIALSDSQTLYYSRNSSHLPVAELKLTEGSPCIDVHEFDHATRSRFKKLSRNIKKGCNTILENDVLYDERYRFVTSEDNYENIKSQAHWEKAWGKASTMNLYQRSYIQWGSE